MFSRPEPALLRLADADRLRDQKNWREAAILYEAYLQKKPADFHVWIQLGHMRKESGDYPGAEEAYFKARALNNADSDLFLQLGHLEKLRGNLTAALSHYRRSAALDDHNTHALEEVEIVAALMQAPPSGPAEPVTDNAQAQAEAAVVEASPPASSLTGPGPTDLVDPVLAAADRARDLRQWAQAAILYKASLDLNSDNFPIWVQLGNMRKEAGDLAGALDAYDAAERLDPANPELYLQRGHLLKVMGDWPRAVLSYRRVVALDPAHADANRELAAAPEEAKRDADRLAAEEAARRAAPAAPGEGAEDDASGSDLERADRARDTRRWRQAAHFYAAHLRAHPEDFGIWVQLGNVSKEAGELPQSAFAYRAAEKLNPHDPDLHHQIGHLCKLHGHKDLANRSYRHAQFLASRSGEAEDTAARDDAGPSSVFAEPAFGLVDPERFHPDAFVADGGTDRSIAVGADLLSRDDILQQEIASAMSASDWERAAALQRLMVQRNPIQAAAWRQMADVFDRLERPSEAHQCRSYAALCA